MLGMSEDAGSKDCCTFGGSRKLLFILWQLT